MRMSEQDIAEFQFYKRVKKLIPLAMVVCGIMGSLITLTWKSKTFIDTLATKKDIQEIVQPIADRTSKNEEKITNLENVVKNEPVVKGYTQTKRNGLIMLNPVY